jgi:hypothetical protein
VSSFFVLYLAVLGSVAFIGFWNYAKLSGPFRVIVWVVAYTLISESVTRLNCVAGMTFPIYWLYTLVNVPMYLISITLMIVSKRRKLILKTLTLFFLAISAYFFSKTDLLTVFPSRYILSASAILVISILVLFFDLLDNSETKKLKDSCEFLLGSSLLIYRCVTFMHVTLYDYLVSLDLSPWISIYTHSVFTILFYSFLGYIFVVNSKQGENSHARFKR